MQLQIRINLSITILHISEGPAETISERTNVEFLIPHGISEEFLMFFSNEIHVAI